MKYIFNFIEVIIVGYVVSTFFYKRLNYRVKI